MRNFWEETPCGTRELSTPVGTSEFFEALDRDRQRTQPFIADFARFDEQAGKRVLEVGVGPGTDFIRFARAGAIVTGVDLTESAVRLTCRRLELEGLAGRVLRTDAEHLPFPTGSFDFVFSWGVVHHTEAPERAVQEIVRVTRPGGEICVMLYHRYSLVALQSWVVHALLRGRPWRSFASVICNYHESLGTRAYSIAEADDLFADLDARVTPVVTAYDVRVTRKRFAPRAVRRLVPRRLGWFLVVQGRKPDRLRATERTAVKSKQGHDAPCSHLD